MKLNFSVIKSEPLTVKETKLVRMGIMINPIPALKRWVSRDKRNKLKDVAVVETPTKDSK